MSGPVRAGFAADRSGTVWELVISDAVSQAYDIMTADGVPPRQATDMATAAERSGRDPVAFARHFTRLRRGFREG